MTAPARASRGFMGKTWDGGDVAFRPETWAAVMAVMKPGAHLCAFAAPKNALRLACAIEDAGFEIRNRIVSYVAADAAVQAFLESLTEAQADAFLRCLDDSGFGAELHWVFGTGFPKSLDVGKAIDKAAGAVRAVVGSKLGRPGMSKDGSNQGFRQMRAMEGRADAPDPAIHITAPATESARQWDGWGTDLKPAYEPIIVARKPLAAGSVAANVLQHGTGAINVDGCRIHGADAAVARAGEPSMDWRYADHGATDMAATPGRRYRVRRLKPGATLNETGGNWRPEDGPVYEGTLKPGRFPANVVHDGSDDVLAAFDEYGDRTAGGSPPRRSAKSTEIYGTFNGDAAPRFFPSSNGSAARFFFSGKADADDRHGSKHPTVKPVALMRWLVRLVTPAGGVVLDPFAGTGTTGIAAIREGRRAVLIEREPEYLADIRRRLDALDGRDAPLFAVHDDATGELL